MRTVKRIAVGLALAVLAAVYTVGAAVRAVPGVRARKEDARQARRTSPNPPGA